ncbi:MAG: putative 4-hydroxybenzoate polyprenyltransferase [Chloracidobacterium sp.]|nr:putative 4-hydroxybenzoate polyprenyltransferase [Chloracidobacterium sp.]MDW8216938.1 UbiA-like polyprenyltransferase [Acidobacteriota bacterium]
MSTVLRDVKITCEMIKIEHTLFALPFAFLGAFLAARGLPSPAQMAWITVAMVGARSAAMAFNRLVDEKYDAANPRTAGRALPAGLVSRQFVVAFTVVSAALFILAAAMLNRLALWLSPVALGSVLLYSYTKRFTALSHIVLGWCLAIAPAGAWIAVRGTLEGTAVLLSLCVLLWTAGFDILYACQDYDFDRQHPELHSLPKRLGVARAMAVARGLHAAMFFSLVALVAVTKLGWLAVGGVLATGGLLIHQHRLVSPTDLSRLDAAFFTTNAFVSVILFLTLGADAAFLSR